jgi:predicted lipoprotein with Yx(FWY)xxD motif
VKLKALRVVCLTASFLTASGGTDTAGSQDSPASGASSSAAEESDSQTSGTMPSAQERGGVALKVAGSDFGEMLFDQSGQAIYLFTKETSHRPRCYGECAEAWPPVVSLGSARATGEVRAGLLGTVRRDDGSIQVTYAGHPLYYYAHEGKNQVLCHNVVEFGGTWLVVTPNGEPAA